MTTTTAPVRTFESVLCHGKDEHADMSPYVACYQAVRQAKHVRSALRDGSLRFEELLLARTGTPTGTTAERDAERVALLETRELLRAALARADDRIAALPGPAQAAMPLP